MDVLTPRQRSHCMSRIRGKDTGPEVALRRALWAARLRYRLHYSIPGRPDIAFPGARVAVFVDGCFWHGCPLHSVKPKTNPEFWQRKIGMNMSRDHAVVQLLRAEGWSVLRFWEHEVNENASKVTARIARTVRRKLGRNGPRTGS
jgi:DNA mismatch endonuclease, patch repair protein